MVVLQLPCALQKAGGSHRGPILTTFHQVEKLMLTYPSDLLRKHGRLLEGDFTELGEGSTLQHQCWIASMESVVLADKCVRPARQVWYWNLGSSSPPVITPCAILRQSLDDSLLYWHTSSYLTIFLGQVWPIASMWERDTLINLVYLTTPVGRKEG